MTQTRTAEVYVALLGEGTTVWRPVAAEDCGANVYRLAREAPDPDEIWEFAPGTFVRCERRVFAGGDPQLVAVESIPRAV